MKKGMVQEEKLAYAQRLGVSLMRLYSSSGILDEPELDRRILQAEQAEREERRMPNKGGAEAGAGSLHPWSVVCAVLFEGSSDNVVDIVSLTGVSVDWSLDEKEAYSHTTRKRAFRPRVDAAVNDLPPDDRLRATWVVASELIRRDEGARERLSRRLRPIGWQITESGIAPGNREISELFFAGGTPHDAYVEIRRIFHLAQASIAVIDPYLDSSILQLLASSPAGTLHAKFLTWKVPADFAHELQQFGAQHRNIAIEARRSSEFHDRFVILDDTRCFHVGASLKDAGIRAFMISQVEDAENVRALLAEQRRAWDGSAPI